MHSVCIPSWAEQNAMRFERLYPPRTALLVVDLQNGFLLPDGYAYVPEAVSITPNVNRLTMAFRGQGALVTFIRHTVSDNPRYWVDPDSLPSNHPAREREHLQMREGFSHHELHHALDINENDLVVNKHRYSAMLPTSSDLHHELQRRGIDTVVICGAATNCCCETTARDASMMNYRVFFASDATATLNDDMHNAALLNLSVVFADVRTTQELIDLVESPPAYVNRPSI